MHDPPQGGVYVCKLCLVTRRVYHFKLDKQ